MSTCMVQVEIEVKPSGISKISFTPKVRQQSISHPLCFFTADSMINDQHPTQSHNNLSLLPKHISFTKFTTHPFLRKITNYWPVSVSRSCSTFEGGMCGHYTLAIGQL